MIDRGCNDILWAHESSVNKDTMLDSLWLKSRKSKEQSCQSTSGQVDLWYIYIKHVRDFVVRSFCLLALYDQPSAISLAP